MKNAFFIFTLIVLFATGTFAQNDSKLPAETIPANFKSDGCSLFPDCDYRDCCVVVHIISAKAVAFGEALREDFKAYQQQILDNAQALADELTAQGLRLVSGGTDNHLMLVDVFADGKGITGKVAEKALDAVHITVNKNTIPFDQNSPFVASGVRIGTPALTTRGMKETEMKQIGKLIASIIREPESEEVKARVKKDVTELTAKFPLYAHRVHEDKTEAISAS